jgi:flap endonuclease-1
MVFQFVELCILLGCDYLEPAKGVGPKTALKLMREHGSLDSVVQFIRGKMAEKQEEVERFEQEVLEREEVPGEESESEDDLHVDSEEEGLDVDVDGFESEDGYEKGVKADLAGNEEELDVPAQTTIGKAKGKGKKSKVVLDSDDSDQEDEKPTEPTKEKEGSPNWESSPEPTSPQKTPSTPKPAAKKTPASSKTSSTQTQAKSKSKKPTATTSTQGKKKPPAKGGMQLPEYWPWEEAKKIFMTPDVTPGAELEVSPIDEGWEWEGDERLMT